MPRQAGRRLPFPFMELVKFTLVLMLRAVQATIGIALIPFSVFLAMMHLVYYWGQIALSHCSGEDDDDYKTSCNRYLVDMLGAKFHFPLDSGYDEATADVGLPDDASLNVIRNNYDENYKPSVGIMCWDWGTTEASGLIECIKSDGNDVRSSFKRGLSEYSAINKTDKVTSKYSDRAQKHSNMKTEPKKEQKKGEFN